MTDDLRDGPPVFTGPVVPHDAPPPAEDAWRQRAEQAEADLKRAEAQIAEVRRLQNMTIAASCRAHAIEQAEDTLAALERASKAALDQPREHA